MYVPSYAPEPIEITGSVAEEKWPVIVGFVRRVSLLYLATLALAISLSSAPFTPMPLSASLPLLLATLVGLSIMRKFGKGKSWEPGLSGLLAPLLFFSLGLVGKELRHLNVPVWAMFSGPAVATVYVMIARRDLSFLGMFLFGLAGSSALIFYYCQVAGEGRLLTSLLANGAFLFYFVYDLAALLTRRRLGEELGAVIDLYRDVLNVFSYPFRVWRHWREHRIWAIPK